MLFRPHTVGYPERGYFHFQSGCVEQKLEVVDAVNLTAVGDFLAPDAERRPRHCRQSFGADVLFAMQAHAEAPVVVATERCAYAAQEIRIAVQTADRQLALRRMLYFIESVGALLDSDAVAIANQLHQLCLLDLQHVSVFVQFTFGHLYRSSFSRIPSNPG